jgi:aminomethyltransferase
MVDFGGWDMPVQYPAGTIEEHLRTRTHAGLFDVSHMGEIDVHGSDAIAFVNKITSNDVTKLVDGQAQYTALTTPSGTVVDDLLVYRLASDHLLLVVNASTTDKDWEWIESHHSGESVKLNNVSSDYCQLALQGPDAQSILQKLTDLPLDEITYYRFTHGSVDGVEGIISRTGYTGEDGFELYFRPEFAAQMWDALTANTGVTPVGLGARDTLRLEMGFALYGNDIDSTTTPLEANLGWLVKLKKDDFVGREALIAQKQRGLERKLTGFVVRDKAFPRHGYPVFFDGTQHGLVRSGTVSPTLGIAIGTCYLPPEAAAEGTAIEIEIRGKRVPAQVVKMPFYQRRGR